MSCNERSGSKNEMTDDSALGRRKLRIGFRTSIITVFIATVLFVGLTLVYLLHDGGRHDDGDTGQGLFRFQFVSGNGELKHDLEKCEAVFRKDHARTKS